MRSSLANIRSISTGDCTAGTLLHPPCLRTSNCHKHAGGARVWWLCFPWFCGFLVSLSCIVYPVDFFWLWIALWKILVLALTWDCRKYSVGARFWWPIRRVTSVLGARCRSCVVFFLYFLFGSAKYVVSIFATQLERKCSLNLGFDGSIGFRCSRPAIWNHLRDSLERRACEIRFSG